MVLEGKSALMAVFLFILVSPERSRMGWQLRHSIPKCVNSTI